MKTDYATVRVELEGGAAVLTLDNPPVNQMSGHFTDEIREAVRQAQEDPAVKVLVLIGAGRNFLAGADVTQLLQVSDKAAMVSELMGLHQWFNAMEQGAKPIIAAISGVCLGGGLELAMACHYRIAAPGASLGLPEVRMGLIPGAGGTQRLPRIIGLPAALELMTAGQVIKAEKGISLGLIDELAPAEGLRQAALGAAARFQQGLLDHRARRASGRIDRLPSAAEKPHIIADARRRLAPQEGRYPAPFKLLEAVDKGLGLDPAADQRREAELFGDCVTSPVAKNLIGLFLSERAAGKLSALKGLTPARPRRVAVLGGGVMGSGIVHLLLAAGLETTLWDIDEPALARARQAVAKTFAFQIKKGQLKPGQLEDLLAAKLSLTTSLEDLAGAELIIEAVLEDMAVKQGIWRGLEGVCRPEAIFATNTSALPITEMAKALQDPGRLLGLHFFNPAERMPLLEIIRARKTSDQTLASGVAMARAMRKVPVVVNDGPGFYVTRQLISLPVGALYLLADGLDMESIDRAIVEFGLPMGPFTLEDLTGIDIGHHVGHTFARVLGERYRPHPLAEAIHALGDFGRKTGRGFYDYGGPKPAPNPRVLALVEEHRRARGIVPRQAGAGAIVEALMALAINEAALMIEQGVCDRPADMDLAMVQGTGFPPYRGGVLRHADQWGLDKVHAELLRLAERYGPRFAPCDLIRSMAAQGGRFYPN